MKINLFIRTLIFFMFCAFNLQGSNFPPKSELCPKGDCRGQTTIKLIQKDGKDYIQKNEYMYPVVQSIGVSILAGEEIAITGDFVDGKLKNILALPDSLHKKALFIFHLSQEKQDMMILNVTNKSNFNIKYHLAIMPIDKENLFKTSTCPVGQGMSSFESWPFPIYQALIAEIFVVNTGDSSKCVY